MPPSPGEIPESSLAQYGKIIQPSSEPPAREKSINVSSLEHLLKIASDARKPVLRYSLPGENKDHSRPETIFFAIDEGRYYVYKASVLPRSQELTRVVSQAPQKIPTPKTSLNVNLTQGRLDSRYTQLSKKASIQKPTLLSLSAFSNIWFLRSLCMTASIVVSSLLLAYSFIFLQAFFSLAGTTSYFPWSWHVFYTNPNQVISLFYIGLGVSITFLSVSANLLVYFLILFRRSFSLNMASTNASFEGASLAPTQDSEEMLVERLKNRRKIFLNSGSK
jgi:hypothetical protein